MAVKTGKKKKGTSTCTVNYEASNNRDIPFKEDLSIDSTLEEWIMAEQMACIATTTNGTLPSTKKHPVLSTKRPRHSKPYSLDEFIQLLHSTEQVHHESIEDLEKSKFVNQKSTPEEVYGRMLPRAIDVSFYCRIVFIGMSLSL